MNDTLLLFSSTMSNDHERIRQIKYHINQLLSELHRIESNNNSLENFQPFNLTNNSSLTTMSHEKCLLNNQCPYLSCKHTRLHSTTYNEYKKFRQRKKLLKSSPKKKFFAPSVCATSTPKNSPKEHILLKHHLTSTPRRNKRQSTNIIPLKRLLYTNKDSNRQRYSIKRSLLPGYNSLNPIEENPQWI
jgi:hypothetical protein